MRYIGILRGINVGGKRKILMADLKALLEKLNLKNITTYIQSGNLIFDSEETDQNFLANKITLAIQEKYGFDVPCIVRSINEWEESVKKNPFLADHDIEHLHLTFLKEIPNKEKVESISYMNFSPDAFQLIGKDVFLLCPGKYHKTKLGNQFFENKLKVQATTRNWKSVTKLLELAKNT